MKKFITTLLVAGALALFNPQAVFAQACTAGQSYCSPDHTKAYICNSSTLQYQEFDCAAVGYVCVEGTGGAISLCAPPDLERPATCTPNTAFCDGNVRRICNATGTASVGAGVDCASLGQTCVEAGGSASCVSSALPPPPGSYENCLSRGNTPSECNAAFPQAGSAGGGIIDLNALIESIAGSEFAVDPARFRSLTTLGGFLTGTLPILYGLAGVGLLIFLIVSGFSYLTSSGDPKKMEAAKGQITAAVLGFILIIAAFWITQIVNYIFGLGSGV